MCIGNLATFFLWKCLSLSQVLLGPRDVQVFLEDRAEFQNYVDNVPVKPKPQSVSWLSCKNCGEEEEDAEVERNEEGRNWGIQHAIQMRNQECLWSGRWGLVHETLVLALLRIK